MPVKNISEMPKVRLEHKAFDSIQGHCICHLRRNVTRVWKITRSLATFNVSKSNRVGRVSANTALTTQLSLLQTAF